MRDFILTKTLEIKQGLAALLLTGVTERVCSFLIKRTESIAANSTSELIVWGFKRLFKQEKKIMSFQKQYPLGDVGQLTISESAGSVSLSISASHSAGGGSMAGVASASLSASVQLSFEQLIDAALDMSAEKFPAAKSLIDAAKAGIHAELAK